MQRWVVEVGCGKVKLVSGIVSHRGVIGSHIGGVRRDGHRRRKVHLLPTRSTLPAEGGSDQQRPAAAPQTAGMRAGIQAALVKANAGNVPTHIGVELNPNFHGTRIARDTNRGCRTTPDRAGTRAGAGRQSRKCEIPRGPQRA